MSGRKVALDKVIVPSPELESCSSQISVLVIATPLSAEANDDDHETSNQVTTAPRRYSRVRSVPVWYGDPILELMLLDHDKPTNYEEAMMSPDSVKWLEAIKSEVGSMYENKVWTLVDLLDDLQAMLKDGSSRGRRALTVVLLSTKLDLLRKVFDKFKVLNMMRFSHS